MRRGMKEKTDATFSVHAAFNLTGRVAVITGGAGLLGIKHSEAVADMGDIPVLADLNLGRAQAAAEEIARIYDVEALGLRRTLARPGVTP